MRSVFGEGILSGLLNIIIRFRWLVLLVSIIGIFLLSAGMKHLVVNSNYRVFFSEDNKQLKSFDQLQANYTKSDNILFVIVPESNIVFSAEVIDAVKELTTEAWKIPFAVRVDSITNYQHTSINSDELIVDDLIPEDILLSEKQLMVKKDIAVNEPVLRNRLISPNGAVTGVNVIIQVPENAQKEIANTVAAARQLQQRFETKYTGIKIKLTGIVMMNAAFSESSKADMGTLLPAMLLIALLIVGLLLRSIIGVLTTFVVILMAVAASLGWMGWMGWMITGPSSSAITIIFTIAVADCVHVFSSFLQSSGKSKTKNEAIVQAIDINFKAMLITSLTTAIGFLSLNFSDTPPYRDLGNVVAFGVIIAFILSVTFLPALISILPIRVKAERYQRQTLIMTKLADFVINNPIKLIGFFALSTVILATFVSKNQLDDQFLTYFSEKIDFRRATDFTNENLTGIYTIEYSLKNSHEGGVHNPEFFTQVEEFIKWARKQPEVVHVYSFTDTLKRLNQNLNGGDQSDYVLPKQQDLAAQYMLLYEMSLPYGLDVNTLVDIQKKAYRVIMTLDAVSSQKMLELEARFDNHLRENTQNIEFFGSSPNLIFAHIGLNNAKSMFFGMLVALALITIVLIIAFRSLRLGLISILPNMMPAVMAFGIWGIFNGEVGISIASALGLTIGIVVDDTVHFLSKYQRFRQQDGLSPEDAFRNTFSGVGMALLVTSIVLVAGFLIFTSSSFAMNSDLGIFVAITIVFALLIDFFFLAPLILFLDKKTEKSLDDSEQAIAVPES